MLIGKGIGGDNKVLREHDAQSYKTIDHYQASVDRLPHKDICGMGYPSDKRFKQLCESTLIGTNDEG